jgi:hypothetical protein
MIIENDFGVFVGQKCGVCIEVSIPGQTDNDWKVQSSFLDLPLMDEETYENFLECLNKLKAVFKKE